MKTATNLLKQARDCGLSYARSAEEICPELFTVDHFSDEHAVSRLMGFVEDGCVGLRAGIKGKRI